jgi:uncharacterized protein (TIGR00255 family)
LEYNHEETQLNPASLLTFLFFPDKVASHPYLRPQFMAMSHTTIKSMTAFGRSYLNSEAGSFTVEIQSLNRRYLEINLSLPRSLTRYEMEVRKLLESKIYRGQLNVSVFWRDEKKCVEKLIPNLELAKAVKVAWELIAKEVQLPFEFSLELLAREKDILIYEENVSQDETLLNNLKLAVDQALNALLEMRIKEGSVLAEDLKKRFFFLQTSIDLIAENASSSVSRYRQKLTQKLQELFDGNMDHEDKILREIAIFADRVDITEEIVRFRSHLLQCFHILQFDMDRTYEAPGKKLEFLLQELNREANTIGAKAPDLIISQEVIKIKSESEKLREQIHNIE